MNAPLHGLRARLSSSGLSVHGPRQGAPTVITDVHGIDGTPAGAVYGPVTTAEAQSLVTALAGGGDPGGPDVPWMAVARSGDAGLAAAAATMLPSGLFWSWSDGGLTVATDPGSAAGIPRAVNPDYVRDYASGHADPQATPFVGVHRLTAGCTALWDGVQSQPRVTQWSGPAVWDEPELEGSMALEAYLAAFDIVVADLARRAGPLVATVSGGLDSTFVAAALAAATKSASPVRGLVYTPLPQARLVTAAGVVADESGAARALGNYYPGRLTIETVVDNAMIRPLDAALDIAHRSGVPTFNPANQPWLTAMRQIAAADGARLWFVGSNGNAAFSFTTSCWGVEEGNATLSS